MIEYKVYPLAWLYSAKKKEKSPHFTVRVSDTKELMIQDIESISGSTMTRSDRQNLDGYFIGFIQKKSPMGHIFASKQTYSTGLIAHEAVHMAALYYRNFSTSDSSFTFTEDVPEVGVEEFIAYSVGEIVNQVEELVNASKN